MFDERPDWAIGGRWFRWVSGVLHVWTPDEKLYRAPVPAAVEPSHRSRARARMGIPGPGTAVPCPVAISAALDGRRMGGYEAAVAVGEGVTTLTGWRKGTIVPSDTQVRRLATLTGLPVDLFYRPPV